MSRMQETIFTLYGDYIRHRGGEAWTGNLIELLGLFGVSGQAVRSTLSRMSRKGWLEGREASRFSFYSLTPRCLELRNAVWTISLPTAERIEPNRQTTITEALDRSLAKRVAEMDTMSRSPCGAELTFTADTAEPFGPTSSLRRGLCPFSLVL